MQRQVAPRLIGRHGRTITWGETDGICDTGSAHHCDVCDCVLHGCLCVVVKHPFYSSSHKYLDFIQPSGELDMMDQHTGTALAIWVTMVIVITAVVL